MKKKVVWGAIIVALGIAGLILWQNGYIFSFWAKESAKELVLYGNVDIREVALAFRVGGRVESMRVEEGAMVTKGELLASLEQTPFKDTLRVARAQLTQSEAELAKLENGNRSEETAQVRALVEQRRAAFGHARREMQRQKALYESRVISKRLSDLALTEFEESKARLESAEEALQLSTAGYREEDIAAGRAGVQLAQARLAQEETKMSDTSLFASAAGMILTRVAEPGEVLAAGQTVYTLSLYDPVWVRAYVDELDLGKVYMGMKAQIYTDSAPGRPYSGRVGFISPEAEFTPKSVQTPVLRTALVYRLRVIADNPDDGLRQGMPVTVHLALK